MLFRYSEESFAEKEVISIKITMKNKSSTSNIHSTLQHNSIRQRTSKMTNKFFILLPSNPFIQKFYSFFPTFRILPLLFLILLLNYILNTTILLLHLLRLKLNRMIIILLLLLTFNRKLRLIYIIVLGQHALGQWAWVELTIVHTFIW